MTLYEGELSKRGKLNKSWKQRWFVLTEHFKLEYYKTKSKSKEPRNALGCIGLLQIQRIEVSLLHDIEPSSIPMYIHILSGDLHTSNTNRMFLINLKTQSRTYHLSANDSASFISWIDHFHSLLFDGTLMQSLLEIKNDPDGPYYFVLHKHRHLKYFNNEHRDMLIGCIDLNTPSLSIHTHSTKHMHIIEVTLGKRKKRTMLLSLYTKHSQIFNEWITHLKPTKHKHSSHKTVHDADHDTLYLGSMHFDIIPHTMFPNAHCVKTLILTNNKLQSLCELKYFPNISTLQLDRNGLEDINDLPRLNKLTTLWLNNNEIHNANDLLLTLKKQCPHLEYLSLLFNPLCCGMDEIEHKTYRLTLIYHLTTLRYLDSERVDEKERYQAMYGDDDDPDEECKQQKKTSYMSTASSSLWSPTPECDVINLEQHEEALKKQMTHLVQKLNYRLCS